MYVRKSSPRQPKMVYLLHSTLNLKLTPVSFEMLNSVFEPGVWLLCLTPCFRPTLEIKPKTHLYAHLFKLPFSHLRKWSVGETLARVSETDTTRSFLVGTSTGVFLDLPVVVILIGVLFSLSVSLTMIVMIALPLQALVYFAFGPFLSKTLVSHSSLLRD